MKLFLPILLLCTEEEGWLDGWEEFIIPSKEITLTSILSHNWHETTFRYVYNYVCHPHPIANACIYAYTHVETALNTSLSIMLRSMLDIDQSVGGCVSYMPKVYASVILSYGAGVSVWTSMC